MKKTLGSRWLVISYFCGVDGLACSHHADDRLAALRRHGVDTTTIASIIGRKRVDGSVWRVPSPTASGLRFEIRMITRRWRAPSWVGFVARNVLVLPLVPFYVLEKLVARVDTTWGWSLAAAISGSIAARVERASLIYSTGGPISAHLAAAVVARVTGLPWFAELQDPLVHSYCARSKLEYRLTCWAERLICRHADRIVFVTQQAREETERRAPMGDKGVTIYSGASKAGDPAPGRVRREPFTIAHMGSLMGARSLVVTLDALKAYFDKSPEASRSFLLQVIGSLGDESGEVLKEFPYPEAVEVTGTLSRSEATAAMREVDALLLVQGTDDVAPQTIPSKLYEYLHAGVPILGLVHRNRELTAILEGLGHVTAAATDPEDVAAKIETLHREWLDGDAARQVSRSPFTVDAVAMQMIALQEDLTAGGR